MFFKGLADKIKAASEAGASEFKRFTDKATLRAAVAAAMKTAYADGDCDSDEKAKAFKILSTHAAFAHFQNSDIVKSWQELDGNYDLDPTMGDMEADKWLKAAADRPEEVRKIMALTACLVAGADNEFDADEVTSVKSTCNILGVDPKSLAPLVMAAEGFSIAL